MYRTWSLHCGGNVLTLESTLWVQILTLLLARCVTLCDRPPYHTKLQFPPPRRDQSCFNLEGCCEDETRGQPCMLSPASIIRVHERVLSHFSHVQLCDPMDCSLPVPLSMRILQARILKWVVMPSSNLPDPGIKPKSLTSPALAGGFFTTSST